MIPNLPLRKSMFAALCFCALTLAAIAATGTGAASAAEAGATPAEAFEAVNPWIGTFYDTSQNKGNAAYGNTWPGAAMPFGMTQFTPTTHGLRSAESDAGGYEFEAPEIRGFGMTRLSGTGCEGTNSAFDIPLLPYTGALGGEGGPATSPGSNIKSFYLKYKHENEVSSPGYYKVGLDDGVEAQLGATLRTTVGKFAYPTGKESSTLLVNASGSNNDSGETSVKIDPATETISGFTTAKTVCGTGTYRIYFSSDFDAPFATYGTWSGATETADGTEVASSAGKDQTGAYVSFAAGSTVTVRTGISYVSVEGAEENRTTEAPQSKSFETVRAEARQAWEEALGTVSIKTSSATERATFYTALYHALLQPNVYEDVDGKYRAYGTGTTESSEVKELAPGQEHEYATYSGWDQYRSQSQLIALLFPKVGSDIAQSITDLATQTGHWYNWPHLGSGQDKMNGDALQSMVAEYAAFGDTGFDEEAALKSMVETQSLPGTGSTRTNLLSDVAVGWLEDRTENGTSTTLEYATADFGIAQLAKELGDTEAAESFMTRAQHWQNLVSPATHAIVPRDRTGYWSLFDLTERNSTANEPSGANQQQYDQSTGYQYQWSVPFDVTRLIEKLGGKAEAKAKLEQLLLNLDAGVYGVTGDYLSNEPAFITPWIWSWLGEPDKTTATIDRVRSQLFSDTPGGLQGNDDLGALSAYYVWSSIGLYPAIYGRSELLEAAPAFESVVIHSLGSARAITISAPGATTKRDVTTTTVDGVESQRSWLPESFAKDGGTLEFTLGETPTAWGTGAEDVPPSYDEGTNGYNGIATTANGAVNAGSLDFSGNSLSREKLAVAGLSPGAKVKFDGVEFTWPNTKPGEFDSWVPHGQVVPMGDVRASKISFLGLATNGPSQGSATVVYSDGTTQKVAAGFTDWTTGAPAYGNTIIAATSGRNTSAGSNDSTEARVFATEVAALEPSKLVESVILPEDVTSGVEHIFAVGTDSLPVPKLSSGSVTAGAALTVSGSGFDPNEAVTLTLSGAGGTVVTGSAAADASGNLSSSLAVAATVAGGSYTLTATGAESDYPVSATVSVSAAPAVVTQTGTTTTTTTTTATTTQSTSTSTAKVKAKTKTATSLKVSKGAKAVTVTVAVSPGSATGKVTLLDGSKTLKTLTLKKGKASLTLKLAPGSHKLSAHFLGSADDATSKSKTVIVKVTKK